MPTKLQAGKIPNQLLKSLLKDLPVFGDEVVIPPALGIDAAGLRVGDRLLAITSDPITFASKQIGKYAVRVNVNDIACMGCRPRWMMNTLLLPLGTTDLDLYELWHELVNELKLYQIQAIGGHTEVTAAVNQPVLVCQMIGEPVTGALLDIRSAKPGDKMLLWRGAAVEGSALLATERYDDLKKHIPAAQLDTMRNLINEPGICIWPAAEKLFALDGLVALHDPTEGGIATALHEVAEVSGCGIQVRSADIPILSETLQLAALLKFDPLGLLASGSLIIVCRPEAEASMLQALRGERVASIGELTEEQGSYIDGKDLPRYDRDQILDALAYEL
jgi:hydrogenase expression/formation protein HypE